MDKCMTEKMVEVDDLLTHVWMVRTFLKHSEEAEDWRRDRKALFPGASEQLS